MRSRRLYQCQMIHLMQEIHSTKTQVSRTLFKVTTDLNDFVIISTCYGSSCLYTWMLLELQKVHTSCKLQHLPSKIYTPIIWYLYQAWSCDSVSVSPWLPWLPVYPTFPCTFIKLLTMTAWHIHFVVIEMVSPFFCERIRHLLRGSCIDTYFSGVKSNGPCSSPDVFYLSRILFDLHLYIAWSYYDSSQGACFPFTWRL